MKVGTTTKTVPPKRSRSKALAKMAPVVNRVTVRLKPELAQRLAAARSEQGRSVTEIIEQALAKHLQPVRRKPKMTLLEAMEKHGLLGTVNMPPDASVNYKKYISEYLDEKYPQHAHR